jgi:hypothetical protein
MEFACQASADRITAAVSQAAAASAVVPLPAAMIPDFERSE